MEIIFKPIGKVISERKDCTDDYWGKVVSVIQLDEKQFDISAVLELETFSHLEVIFYMHLVKPEEVQKGSRRPRGEKKWSPVGIFAQRAKGRPNQIGLSRCQLIQVKNLELTVRGLDAIDGTPVLDIKPYFKEFAPLGEIRQPNWASELMQNYYKEI